MRVFGAGRTGLWTLVIISIIAAGCSISPDTIEAPEWTPELLAPLAQATLEMEDLEELSTLRYSEEVSVSDLDLLPVSGQVEVTVGPYPVDMFEGLIDMNVGTFSMRYKMESNMSLTIEEGTVIRFATADDDRTVIELIMDEPLTPFGTFVDSVTLSDVFIEEDMVVWFENMDVSLGGGLPNPNEFFTTSGEITLKDIGITHFKGDESLTFSDTSEFSLDLKDFEDLNLTGSLNLLMENEFPIEGSMEVFFLASDGKTVLDQLTPTAVELEAPEFNGNGVVTAASSQEVEVYIDPARSENISNAEFIAFDITLTTPPSQAIVEADQNSHLDLKVIADIQLSIKP